MSVLLSFLKKYTQQIKALDACAGMALLSKQSREIKDTCDLSQYYAPLFRYVLTYPKISLHLCISF